MGERGGSDRSGSGPGLAPAAARGRSPVRDAVPGRRSMRDAAAAWHQNGAPEFVLLAPPDPRGSTGAAENPPPWRRVYWRLGYPAPGLFGVPAGFCWPAALPGASAWVIPGASGGMSISFWRGLPDAAITLQPLLQLVDTAPWRPPSQAHRSRANLWQRGRRWRSRACRHQGGKRTDLSLVQKSWCSTCFGESEPVFRKSM